MWPDKDPTYVKWLSWCWKKPVYIGFPLTLGVFAIVFWDLAYILYWWATHWGQKRQ
jgi:hypothetical protein